VYEQNCMLLLIYNKFIFINAVVLPFDFISNNTLIKRPGSTTNVEAHVLSVERPLNYYTKLLDFKLFIIKLMYFFYKGKKMLYMRIG